MYINIIYTHMTYMHRCYIRTRVTYVHMSNAHEARAQEHDEAGSKVAACSVPSWCSLLSPKARVHGACAVTGPGN